MLSKQERAMVDAALGLSTIELQTTFPQVYERHRSEAQNLIEDVAKIYGDAAKTPYFATSLLRYEQYFAVSSASSFSSSPACWPTSTIALGRRRGAE